jgi:hypothetical protein
MLSLLSELSDKCWPRGLDSSSRLEARGCFNFNLTNYQNQKLQIAEKEKKNDLQYITTSLSLQHSAGILGNSRKHTNLKKKVKVKVKGIED